MGKYKTDVVYKVTSEAKGNSLEIGNLYFKYVPVTYAKVLAPAKKYQSDDTAYQLNVFINADTMEKLEEIGINKEFAEVGATKIKKGANRGNVKYPLNEVHENYEGMFAAQLGRDTVKRDKDGAVSKEYAPLKLLDADGNPFTQEVGNGSVCTVKCFAYRNTDGMLVVMVDTVVVIDHIAYDREDSYYDEELGITVKVDNSAKASSEVDVDDELIEPKPTPASKPKAAQKPAKAAVEEELDDGESPF